jgi:putative SOS response-associated peptidase YedK
MGLIPFCWAKDPSIGLRTINAKAETITTAPAFRDAIKYRRSLVPADAFYEWQSPRGGMSASPGLSRFGQA